MWRDWPTVSIQNGRFSRCLAISSDSARSSRSKNGFGCPPFGSSPRSMIVKDRPNRPFAMSISRLSSTKARET